MLTVKRYTDPFFGFECTEIYKDGKFYIEKIDGKITYKFSQNNYLDLNRSQGFKYWKKYFPKTSYFDLPIELQVTINKPGKKILGKNGKYYYG